MTGKYRPSPALLSRTLGLAIVTLLWWAIPATAGMLTEEAWSAEIPKVVYATRQEQSITDTPSSVTLINREMIEALGATNLADILNLVPGFQVAHTNGMTYAVTPHGFSDRYPKRLEVRVNGRSVYLPQLSSVAWESLGVLPEDVSHIEVVRGSNVPSYGSNAIMGAVNIVTINPVQQRGGSLTHTSGSAGTVITNFRQSISLSNTDLQIRAGRRESNGFKNLDDDGHINHLVIDSVYTPGLADSLEFELGVSDGQIGVGDGDHPDEFADDHRRAAWLGARWQREFDDQLWKLRLSYTDYKFERSWQLLLSEVLGVPPDFIPVLTPGHVDEYLELVEGERNFAVADLELEHHIDAGGWQFLWGLGSRMDRLKNREFIGAKSVDSFVYYGFSNLDWQLTSALKLNAGFMVEKKDGFDHDLSPRLALNYHFSEQYHLRASMTRAYRQPALLESDLEWTIRFDNGDLLDLVEVSHPDVYSERVDTRELGFIAFWNEGDINLDLKIFGEKVVDEIDSFDLEEVNCTDPLPEQEFLADKHCPSFYVDGEYGAPFDKRVRVFNNVVDFEVYGAELQLYFKTSERSWLRYHHALLKSHGRWEQKLYRVVYVKNTIDYIPRTSAGLLYNFKTASNWNLSGFLRYRDFMDWRSGTDVSSHTRLDLSVKKEFMYAGGDIQFGLTVQNALDDAYQEFQENNIFRRRILATVNFRWGD